MSSGSRIKKIFVGSAISQTINIGYQFVSVPFFIATWGAEYYGEWLLLFAIPAYFAFTDFGLTAVVNNEILKNVVNAKFTEANQLLNGAFIFISGLSVLLLLGVFIFLSFTDISSILNLRYLEPAFTEPILFILIIYTLISIIFNLLLGVFKALNLYDVGLTISNGMKLSELGVILFLLSNDLHAFSLVLGLLLNRLIFVGVSFGYIIKNAKWFRQAFNLHNLKVLVPFWRLSLSYSCFPLGQAMTIQGSTILVGMLLGPVVTVLFTTTRTLINVLKQITEIIKQSVWVDMARHVGLHRLDNARALFSKTFQATVILGITATLVMLIFGPEVYKYWISGKVEFNPAFFYAMIVGTLTSTVWQIGTVVPESTNTHARFAVFFLSISFLALGLIYMAMPAWGIITIPIVMMGMDLILMLEIKRSVWHTLQLKGLKQLSMYPISVHDITHWVPFLKSSGGLKKPTG